MVSPLRALGFVRRACMAGGLALLVAACAEAPVDPAAAARQAQAFATPWRTLQGGFLAPVAPAIGVQARPGTGMYVKLQAPAAVALRGQELLVADLGLGRLWRADLGFNTLTPIPAAPVNLETRLLIGADYSAWVLDTAALQVLRFGRDGALLQTWRTRTAAPSPSAIALADGGATLLVADRTLGQWAELRSGGALALPVRPVRAGDAEPARVDAVVALRDQVYVLDRLGAAVHRVARDGRILQTLADPQLAQGSGLAIDRWERLYVPDALGRHLLVLRMGQPVRVISAVELGVQQVGGIAVDERLLAVSDRMMGVVQVLMIKPEAP